MTPTRGGAAESPSSAGDDPDLAQRLGDLPVREVAGVEHADHARREVDAAERKAFLKTVCELAVENGGKVFGYALSYAAFDAAAAAGHAQPFGMNYWLGALLAVILLGLWCGRLAVDRDLMEEVI